ncbi:ABC transporter permease [Priestia flexa]|uniref:ABC transporter permease n=1 Tax=Priestia flexa TaxID=86664 RepID=UPI00097076C2|nr:ABC transporter permease [Priestia flexa]
MNTVLIGRFKQLRRSPWAVVVSLFLVIVFAYLMGKVDQTSTTILVYSKDQQVNVTSLIHDLNQTQHLLFKESNENEARDQVKEGKAEVALEAGINDFKLILTSETTLIEKVNQHVKAHYEQRIQTQSLAKQFTSKEAGMINKKIEEAPIFKVNVENMQKTEGIMLQENMQALFGFTLFFIIYTIGFSVLKILQDRKIGVWDRLLISRLSKVDLYTGNLVYSFLIAYVEVIVIFSTFHFGLGVDFNGRFVLSLLIVIPYLLATVALCMFLAGVVKSIAQYQVLIPLLAVSMAMIGGAYWPLEIVTSPVMLTLSKFVPLTYGMDLLKQVVLYDYAWQKIAYSSLLLCIITVVLMALGINILEKKHT